MIETKIANTKQFFEKIKEKTLTTKEREELLAKISKKIADEHLNKGKVNLNFICTHNSRRSQLTQIWSFFAIEYFQLKNIFAYSGGTEVTAFHRNTVKILQKSGFSFHLIDFSHQNPRYLISFKGTKKTILGFSKTFDSTYNKYPYIAITTCDNADENCPFIPNAIHRFHLPFTDPKISDDTDIENETYLQINSQIASDIFTILHKVKKLISI